MEEGAGRERSRSTRALAETCALLLLIGAGAWLERSRGGVESLYVAVVALLGAGLARRWFAFRGRTPPPVLPLLVLELGALAGLVERPIARFGVALAGLAAVVGAWPRRQDGDVEASRGEEAIVAASALAALAATVLERNGGRELALNAVILGVFALEAWGPGAARTAGAAARRMSAFALVFALAVVSGFERVETPVRARDLLFVLAVATALRVVFDLARRPAVVTDGPPVVRRLAGGVLLGALAAVVAALVLRVDLVLRLAAPVAIVAGLVAWRSGALASVPAGARPSPRRARLALVSAVVLAGSWWCTAQWDRLFVGVDTASYVQHSPLRTVLYPTFLRVFDRGPRSPAELEPCPNYAWRTDPEHRLIGAARAQRLLTVLAIAFVAWALAEVVSVLGVALLLGLGVLVDPLLGGSPDARVSFNAGALMSEGLNQPLVFLLLGALLRYYGRPTPARGIGIALVLALLLLNRPANVALLVVFPAITLFHLGRREGARRALLVTAALAAVFAAPVLAECARNHARHGRFKLHPFTGPNILCIALQTATVEDIGAFEDPRVREFLRVCLVDHASIRIPDVRGPNGAAYINVNLWEVAMPAVQRAYALPAEPYEQAYFIDDLFALVGKALIRRHPVEYLGLVLFHFEVLIDGLHVVGVATAVFAAARYRRTRSPELLYVALLGVLPLLAMAPACAFNYPLERYRSQLWVVEALVLPLLVLVLLAQRTAGSGAERA